LESGVSDAFADLADSAHACNSKPANHLPFFLVLFRCVLVTGPAGCCVWTGVSNSAFRQLMEFTYTATLTISSEEEANDVWKAAEYLQMQEALKALNNR